MNSVTGRSGGIPALVTGATGFVGARLAALLLQRGYRVRALVRASSDLRCLAGLDVEIVRGDLGDPASLTAAAAGCGVAFNAAAHVSDWGPRTAFWRVNVDGVANLIAACERARVERIVHLSSLTVLGLPRDGRIVDESTHPSGTPTADHYTASKLAGERLVRVAHAESRLAATIVRPAAIWGPGDPNVVPRIVRLLRRGAMPYIDGGANLVGLTHVDNLCFGLVLAAESPAASGQLYHVTDGEEITARTAIDEIAAVFGTPRPRFSLPYWFVFSVAALVEGGARLVGSTAPPPITRYGVRFVACHSRYDIGKAVRELGYRPVASFRAGIAALRTEGGS